ncbi:MAG: hypothetical protein QNI87_07265 [Erythrobacter sp.]|uniref:hypothetical protein n=1 Tax=Erythrobacter sp. TaxID=1042 RepID=UPI002619EEEC|nr:hypothetical protein [Erythrobacter sp.]MDJ0978319.1 hypothetical protein [Erythrobacter sp.]
MEWRRKGEASKQFKLPLLAASAVAMLAFPTASLALVTLGIDPSRSEVSALDLFTPASVNPELAARIADKSREKGVRFTPAGTNPALGKRTVTVAIRVDEDTAQAISVRNAAKAAPGAGEGISSLNTARFNLGTARGYQSFARTVTLPDSVRDLSMPDLSEFEPTQQVANDKPSRLRPRIELEGERVSGRSANTLDNLAAQTVDVGGAFRISSKIDVTAGVRLSQERERFGPLGPLTNADQDSQAVYVGTQIKF